MTKDFRFLILLKFYLLCFLKGKLLFGILFFNTHITQKSLRNEGSFSDRTSDFVGTHASCANVDRFYIAVIFHDFDFLYIGFPFSVRTSTNLTTVNADSMTFDLAFFTNFTSSHCLHLLHCLYVTQQSYSSRKLLILQEKTPFF